MNNNDFQNATHRFIELYRSEREQLFSNEAAESLARRDAAIARFEECGVPDRKDEEWKYTNLAPVARTQFTTDRAVRALDRSAIDPYLLDNGAGPRLVFVNGWLSEALSDLGGVPAGVTVEALKGEAGVADLPTDLLDRCADLGALPFASLNTALTTGGALIRIPANVQCVEPIQLLFIATADAEPVASFPHIAIIAERGSRLGVSEAAKKSVPTSSPVEDRRRRKVWRMSARISRNR